jgi:hypothetical protein
MLWISHSATSYWLLSVKQPPVSSSPRQLLPAAAARLGIYWTVRACVQSKAGLVVAQMEQSKYTTDLTDGQWAQVQAVSPVARAGRTGRPRRWPARAVWDAIFYQARNGCTWRNLPHDLPPGNVVFGAGAITARSSRCTRPYARWCASKWAKRPSPRPALSTAKPYARRVKRVLLGL